LQTKTCSKCSGHYKYTTKEWIEKVRELHKNKDGTYKYDYSKVNYIGKDEDVEIICPIHGSYFQACVQQTSHLQ